MANTNQSETILTALHYLFTHKDNRVIGNCLDLDLVTSGDNLEQAEERLNAVVVAQIAICYRDGNYSQLLFKAPTEYWKMLVDGKELTRGQLEVEVPPVVLPVNRSSVQLPVYRHESALAAAA